MSVTLVERYNPEWPRWFQRLYTWLESGLGDTFLRIEHVGSTSVPGMVAKPIIDLDIVIPSGPGALVAIKQKLEPMGYVYEGDLGIAGREAFDLVDEERRAQLPRHHLYVCARDSAELRRHLAFRDYLCRHPEQAAELGQLKWALAERYENDKDAYIDGKASLVQSILERALAEKQEQS